ncbi:MAG: leucine-rich repeat protein, partial [Oscillospiraceae bacterium]|nr:leucine-rich repeat protein [Oscillospiraceae bacterium]
GDAFAGSNLEKIILPKSLKTIGQYAFNWVNAEVFVNSALESVESWAFYPWPGQNISVYFMNGAPASVKADSFTPPADAVVELYYYEGTEHLWEFDENGLWNGYKVTMLERPADATLSIDSASIVLGSSKHIKVTMSENSNAALMQFAVKYDPNALKVISCTAGNAVADATINTAEEGMIYFVWEALDSITEKEVLLDIEFAPAEGAEVQNTVVEIVTEGEEFFFADNNLGMLKIDTENGEIRIIDVIYGDINGDEKVNVLDANLIRRYSAKIMEFDDRQLLAADVSGDGKVNVLDANLVRRYSAKIIDIFPVEE